PRLVDANVAVMTAELPELRPMNIVAKKGIYAGFTLGYNRGPLAQQAVEVLRLINAAKQQDGVKSIDVVGIGPAVLLARAVTRIDIANTIIDLGPFDFDQI